MPEQVNYDEFISHIDRLINENNNRQAYELIDKAYDKGLFAENGTELLFRKALILVLCGDLPAADSLLLEIKNSVYLRYCYLKLLMLLEHGEIIKAELLCKEAIDMLSDKGAENPLIVGLYNNYGVIKRMEGFMEEALSNYRKSYDFYLKGNSKVARHYVYQNLIATYLYFKDTENVNKYMSEYENLINPDNMHDFLEIHNFKIGCLRQQVDNRLQIKQLIDGYHLVKEKLPEHQLRIFECSTIRMLFNAGILIINKFMDSIERDLEYYLNMNPGKGISAVKKLLLHWKIQKQRPLINILTCILS